MIRFILYFLTLILLAGLVAGGGLYYADRQMSVSGPLAQKTLFVVPKGAGMSRIAAELVKSNIVSDQDQYIFRAAARIRKVDTKFKAGEYEIPAGISMNALMDLLLEGKTFKRAITVPEGLSSWQIVNLLNSAGELKGDKITKVPSEGVLLPDTWHYERDDTRLDILKRMNTSMAKTLNDLWPKREKDLPIKSKKEALILASIVEKETGVSSERRRVAGVFINRLNKGMLLQTDPTVIYALTKGKIQTGGKGPLGRRLLLKDLKVDSPYNTYRYGGLPPGPIANPGKAAIEAVLNPEKHNYFYFVADGTGGHVFGKNLAEHNRNVANWRKIRRAAAKK